MTEFENNLLKKLLCMKEKEAREKYQESGNEGFKEIADYALELRLSIISSKRW